MTQTIQFAPDYEREEHDWLLFPRDSKDRKFYVPEELWERVSSHPAKQNLYVSWAIVDYVSAPWEETFLDPFGGIGTTMVSAVSHGNRCILIEVEEEYVKTATAIRDHNGWQDKVTIINHDNRTTLPIPCDHIITSPPYGSDLYKDKETNERAIENRKGRTKIESATMDDVAQYAQHPLNIGRLNNFFYVQEMKKLYKKMADSLRPGGTLSITHRDRVKDNQRVLYAMEIVQAVTQAGLKLEVFEKWLAPGSIQSRVNEKLGFEVVLDEDILIFRKPKS